MDNATLIQQNLVIYDGNCRVCNTWANLIKNADENSKYILISRTNSTAEKYNALETDSIILVADDKCYYKSRAVIKILSDLKYPYRIVKYFKWIPTGILDKIYDLVAKNRNKWSKTQKKCDMGYNDETILHLSKPYSL